MATPSNDPHARASAAVDHTDAAAAGAASTPNAEEPKPISLNVRTLDQSTYPITIVSNATVLQLKELVAVATGVVFARQRLIFRGKVLKNDQSIAAYALEDGHTLHLVARAESAAAGNQNTAGDASADVSSNGSASGSSNTDGGSVNSRAAPARNNDEPDPTLGGASAGPNHVLMGATITLNEGANVSMPFLSSMIANIMTSAGGSGVPGHIVISESEPSGGGAGGSHRASYAHFTTRTGAAREASRSRRSRAEPSLRSLSGLSSRSRSSGSVSGGSSSSSMTSGLANLRSRSENLLETIRSNVENTDYDFSGLDELQLESTNDTDAAFLQTHLTQLEILLDHFRTRLHLLPVALRELQRRSTRDAASSSSNANDAPPSVSAIVRSIDTLQTVGELVDILGRIARYLFIRHNPGFTGSSRARMSDGDTVRITSGAAAGGTAVAVNTAAATQEGEPAGGTSDTARRSSSERRSSSHRRRHAGAHTENSRGNALFSLLERMNESIRGVTAGLTGSSTATTTESSATAVASTAPQDAETVRAAAATTTDSAAPAPGSPRPVNSDEPPFSLGGNLELPLSTVVFPISFADMGATTTTSTWDFAALLSRVATEVPASHVFGVVSGDPTSVHQVMAQIGYAVASGVHVPPVTRATIRTWSHALVAELRQQLRAQSIPAHILSLVEPHQQSGFVDQLVRPLEPFVPDLVDFLLRATAASRTATFGASTSAFLGTMARQFVRHMRTFVGGNVSTLQHVLQSLLEHFGLEPRLAAFAVSNLLDWADSRERHRSADTSAESAPANKRRREN